MNVLSLILFVNLANQSVKNNYPGFLTYGGALFMSPNYLQCIQMPHNI